MLRLLSLLLPVTLASLVSAQTPAAPARDAVDKLAAGLKPDRLVTYKKIGEKELQLHIFQPAGFKPDDKRPCFLVIHGGGWTKGAPPRMYPFAKHFTDLGMVGISMQYRLHNATAGIPVFDCVKDARSAVRYVRAHAAEFGIDPAKIIVSGGSAGGHLAAATAQFDDVNEATDDLTVSTIPNVLVLLFPVIDTSKAGYGNAKIGAQWRQISPLHQVRPGIPPTLIFHGTGDKVTPFAGAKAFHDAMLKAGNRCELVVHEGGEHGYLMRDAAILEDSFRKMDAFLKSLGLLP